MSTQGGVRRTGTKTGASEQGSSARGQSDAHEVLAFHGVDGERPLVAFSPTDRASAPRVEAGLERGQRAWEGGLSDQEAYAIRGYKGSGSEVFNAFLAQQANPAHPVDTEVAKYFPVVREQLPLLDGALARASLPHTTDVWRGVSQPMPYIEAQRLVGHTALWPRLTSTSLHPGVASAPHFSGYQVGLSESAPRTLYHVTIPRGAHAAWLEHIHRTNEAEILLARDTRVRYTGAELRKVSTRYGAEYFTIIHAEVVPA